MKYIRRGPEVRLACLDNGRQALWRPARLCAAVPLEVWFRTWRATVHACSAGAQIGSYLTRELVNHRNLRHPHIVGFKKAVLTPTHLAIVMEFASGGEVFNLVTTKGRLSEAEARCIFQQVCSASPCTPMRSRCCAVLVPHSPAPLDAPALRKTAATAVTLALHSSRRGGVCQLSHSAQVISGVGYIHARDMAHRDLVRRS